MSKVGSFGTDKKNVINFVVSENKVLTFNNLERTVSARWATHDLIKKKPRLELKGRDLDTMSFDIKLDVMLGVNPMKVLKKLEKAVNNGTHGKFVLGGKKIGRNQWVITNMSEAYNVIYAQGEVASCDVKITMKEYVVQK